MFISVTIHHEGRVLQLLQILMRLSICPIASILKMRH